MRTQALVVVLVAGGLVACGTGDAGPADGGTDAGLVADAGVVADAGAVADAGEEADAGDETDAGDAPDAGSLRDAGSVSVDAGPILERSILPNGGFERWDDVLPDAWLGLQSNLPEGQVEKVTDDVAEGHNACRITNSSDTHKRFTTAPMTFTHGRYTCTWKVRGHGEIRIARYDTDFSSYTPANYETIDTDEWESKSYTFNVATDVYDTFELVFSIRNTEADRGHLVLDDVQCRRAVEACDSVNCDPWERCVNATASCEPVDGRCNADGDCDEWQQCNDAHRCVVRPDRCEVTATCAATPETPVCDRSAHRCVGGDPCAGVTCASPRTCQPSTGTCGLSPGACVTTADCTGTLPACDGATHTCVEATHPANVLLNGGFESWNTYYVPYLGEHLLPDGWYGLDGIGDSEIDPADVRPWTEAPHSGAKACQLLGGAVADRFTTDAFDLPTGTYTCAYWVRGHGTLRHRHYASGLWSPWTDFLDVDTDVWTQVTFKVNGNVRGWRLILYPGRTQADREHLLVDDVVCTKDR